MTVKELIEKLSECDQTKRVEIVIEDHCIQEPNFDVEDEKGVVFLVV